MARPQNSPVLAQLRSAKTHAEQTAALRVLKNEIVGHVQRKEAWIGLGVLEPIVLTLSAPRAPNDGHGRGHVVSWPLSDEDGVKVQALQLVASFANGGPAFLSPLYAARVVPAVLANACALDSPPQIVVAALKALVDIADAAALAPSSSRLYLYALADDVFPPQHVDALNFMLSVSSPKHLLQSQVTLVCGLVSRLCRDEKHQQALVAAGVLDSLAAQLARIAVRDGLVVPGAEEYAYADGLYEVFPEPAYATASIGPLLEAVAAILGDSKYRASRLVLSPFFLAAFPPLKPGIEGAGQPQAGVSAIDDILPPVPIYFLRNQSASQSSLSTPERAASRTSSRMSLSRLSSATAWDTPRAPGNGGDGAAEEHESPLVIWLVHLARTLGEYDRLMASAVLAALFKAGLGRRSVMEAEIGFLVVPILVSMIERNDKDSADSDALPNPTQRLMLENAPTVLARLITDSEPLQKAAYDCNAVKALSKLLKRAYLPVPEADEPKYWSPVSDATAMDVEGASAASRLGPAGQKPLLAHRLRLREAALKAIGALAAGKEDYRKAFVQEDVVPCVVESLCEYPRKPRQAKERSKDKAGSEAARRGATPAYGTNTVPVIIAACHVVRVLARSVSVLRTALVDYGVALPVFRFMTHPDVRVQVAATATAVNLVVEVSPVRELLTEKGVMKVLCEHAHSDNPALRLNALWALKHFVDAVGPELKKASLEQLEPGWLVQLICDDSRDGAPAHGSRARAAASDEARDDDMEETRPSDEPLRWLYRDGGSMRELDASRSKRLSMAEDKLAAVREAELNPARRARNDDVAIQEQGLGFIRNLIGRPESGTSSETPSETTEMIDHLLAELGQDCLFDILASKLRPRMLHPFARRTSAAGREQRVLHPQAKIVLAVVYILVHMAASIPRHRQLVLAQTDLLKLLAQQAGNKDREVRVALCHLVINLTCPEDEGEAPQCAARAAELKRLGFLAKMETLRHQDRDLDVRERARTAVFQLGGSAY